MEAISANLAAVLVVLRAILAPIPDVVPDEKAGRVYEYDQEPLTYIEGGKSVHATPAGATVRVLANVKPPRKTSGEIDAQVRDLLAKQGWTIVTPNGATVARKTQDGATFWWHSASSNGDIRAVVVREGPPPHTLTLPPPARTIETVANDADFPFIGHLPGAVLQRSGVSQATINATPPGTAPEVLIAPPLQEKLYVLPPSLSPLERMTLYRDALQAAGWTIVRAQAGGDAYVVAHYAQNGRDLYAAVHDGLVQVGDVGAQNEARKLAEQLAHDGHVAIYGIYFDSDKSVLKPESEAALNHVLELLKSDAKLALEVQGHTDSTSTPEHNLQLSAERAAAVKAWLVAHGIAAARLTTRGLGQTQPVADNGSMEGRAKNRRVELARAK